MVFTCWFCVCQVDAIDSINFEKKVNELGDKSLDSRFGLVYFCAEVLEGLQLIIKRHHLFEFEDQSWCPKFVRDGVTGALCRAVVTLRIYDPIFPLIAQTLKNTGSRHVLDLCSGLSGPLQNLRKYFDANDMSDVRLTASDLYPSFPELPAGIDTLEVPLAANEVPTNRLGMRTLFTSFHHFEDHTARDILASAMASHQPIGVFEYTERSFWAHYKMLYGPAQIWLTTPFNPQVSLLMVLFSYLIPIIPLIYLWDGLVSNMRTRTVQELRKLVASIDGQSAYDWQIGKKFSWGFMGNITYLIGQPRDRAVSSGQ